MKVNNKTKVLVVAAHPDDEILGVGGTVAKHILNGDEVYVLIMAEGLTSRDSKASKEELSALKNISIKANNVLGVLAENIFFENLPDNKLDSIPRLDVVKIVEKYIEKIKPEVVYTHHAGDVNIDHRRLYEAVITACRPIPESCVKSIICFETMSSSEWGGYGFLPFNPNYYSDISKTLNLKLKALEVYKGEMREFPHARSIKALENLANWRGSNVGVMAAESFVLVRILV